MMLPLSVALGVVPLLGIAWTIATGPIATVDGLFMSLIMLTVAGIFFLNAFWELRDRGLLAFSRISKGAPETKSSKPTGEV